ncbi:uncharacterized protein V6R79_013492 [Siganus canaliculatus]
MKDCCARGDASLTFLSAAAEVSQSCEEFLGQTLNSSSGSGGFGFYLQVGGAAAASRERGEEEEAAAAAAAAARDQDMYVREERKAGSV